MRAFCVRTIVSLAKTATLIQINPNAATPLESVEGNQTRSTTIAIPCPTPMHMVHKA